MGVNQMNFATTLIIATRALNDISETYGLNYNLICANILTSLKQSAFSTINVSRMFLLKP
jgi:hypothetical protein